MPSPRYDKLKPGIQAETAESPGYMIKNPHIKYITHAIENKPKFLVTISAAFFDLTNPASNIVKPAAIHMTKAPLIRR
jgi:hypothetical protein